MKNIQQVVSVRDGKSFTTYHPKDASLPYPSGGRGGLKAPPLREKREKREKSDESVAGVTHAAGEYYVLHLSPGQLQKFKKGGMGAVLRNGR